MTRFDRESLHRDASDRARSLIAAQPATFLLSVLLATIATAVALGLLAVVAVVQYRWAATVDSIQVSIYMQPQAARGDVESIRAHIEAVDPVSRAELRTREVAWAAMIDSGMSFLAARPNPLPDVWLVTLGRLSAKMGDRSLASLVNETRQTLAVLPGVESVRVDGRWIETLDQQSSWIARGAAWAASLILAGQLLAAFATFFLAGRAYAGDFGETSPSVQALATTGMIASLTALVASAATFALVFSLSPALDAVVKPIATSVGRTGQLLVAAIGIATFCAAALGQSVGGSRR